MNGNYTDLVFNLDNDGLRGREKELFNFKRRFSWLLESLYLVTE